MTLIFTNDRETESFPSIEQKKVCDRFLAGTASSGKLRCPSAGHITRHGGLKHSISCS